LPGHRLIARFVARTTSAVTVQRRAHVTLRVTDAFSWRYEIPMVTVIEPLSAPRPLPDRDLAPTKGSRIHPCKRSTALAGAMSLARAISEESLSREIRKTVAELLKKPASEYLES